MPQESVINPLLFSIDGVCDDIGQIIGKSLLADVGDNWSRGPNV